MEFTVNGRRLEVQVPADEVLVTTLRDRLGLRGVRAGCGVGECGSCTVLVDGSAASTCDQLSREAAGSSVTTPEGLDASVDRHGVREAFLALQAAQCGYCINGIIATTMELADRPESVSLDHLVAALDRHICRCGTHPRILQAACRVLGIALEREEGGDQLDPSDALSACSVVVKPISEDPPIASLPEAILASPRIEQWLRVAEKGCIELLSGRSELGQGVHHALRQVVASHLGVSIDRIRVRNAVTGISPDEGYTVGSRSMQVGGPAVAMAATALRRVILHEGAAALDAAPEDIEFGADAMLRASSGGQSISLECLADQRSLTGDIQLADQPSWHGEPLTTTAPRPDLPDKLRTGAYVHDLVLPGMLHVRAVLPPTYDAHLVSLDTTRIEDDPGVRTVVQDGRLVLVIAEDETTAVRVAGTLALRARWSPDRLDLMEDHHATLRRLPRDPYVGRADAGVDRTLELSDRRVSATYRKPYEAHGAMAPSCAVAVVETPDATESVTVWSHTQGVYPLRRELAALLDFSPERVTVTQLDGPGCYGQNGADDAAGLAAVAARAVPGCPVRFQFSAPDEFAWEPYGSAMEAELTASLSSNGTIEAWRQQVVTDVHTARPAGQGDRLVASWLRQDGPRRPTIPATAGGARNIEPIYDVPALYAVADHVDGPLRTGSLRSLGAFMNIFAIESFMDELAEQAAQDPLSFRLRHLNDPRAREVLETVAEAADWQPHIGPSGRGQGLALSRDGGKKAYVAMAVDVAVDLDVGRLSVERLVMASDAGAIVNSDGLRQQLEGGAVQGLSRTLHEAVRADGRGIHSRGWSTYPVARFSDIPVMRTILISRPGRPPLGAGEASSPLVPAAISNAIDDATGIRVRDLPISADAMRDQVLEMSDDEVSRVLGADAAAP